MAATSSRKMMMRAVQYDKYGGGAEGLKHVEVPIPTPKKDEVLIKMEAGSINQVDWKFQNRIARPFVPKKFPFIPGEVVELGSAVSGFKVGGKVIANSFPDGGGFAEYAVAKASRTATRPPQVSAANGACLPIAAVSALVALRTDGVSLDFALRTHCAPAFLWKVFDRVLAAGDAGSGGVVVDLTPVLAAGDAGSGGVVVDLTPSAAAFATAVRQRVTFSRKRMVPLIVSPAREDMELVAGLVAEGKLKVVIDSRYPLSRAEEGWAKSMAGHVTGKIIVEIGEESE